MSDLTDPLTGLFNRQATNEHVRQELQHRGATLSPVTLILLDVNNFREINRLYLYPAGDQVLVALSRLLVATVRPADHVGRYGGDLFLILAPETGAEQARVLGEQVRSAVAGATFVYKEQPIKITVRLGIGVAEAGVPADFEQLLGIAHRALHEK